MAQPIYTVVINLEGEVDIVRRDKVPYLETKGTSLHKAIKIKESIDD